MGAIAIGPLAFATDRFAAIVGIAAFMLTASVLAARKDERLGPWATSVVLAGAAAARLGHVVEHLDSFAPEPLRAFAVWQGGFSFAWAVPAVVLLTLLRLRGAEARAWAVLPVAVGLLVWNMTLRLADASAGGGKPLPTLTLEQLDGPPIDLAEAGGRPRVLNLWVTWCPPCRRELPLLAEVARATPGVEFLFVNQGEARDKVAGYVAAEGLALRHVLLDSTGEVARHFGTLGIPVTLFFDGDGRLRHQHLGEVSRESLADYLAALVP
jgi:thiol-disulfide isomerase/thioredoxin